MSVGWSIPVYHITSIRNLDQIISYNALYCKAILDAVNVAYTDISYQDIQGDRARTVVEAGPGGTLHDYVPFYFCPRSPMIFAIAHGRVPGYPRGQEELIYLVAEARHVAQAALPFVFTDRHPTAGGVQFRDSLDELGIIDWKVVRGRFFKSYSGDPTRKTRKQAEFLVHRRLPLTLIHTIAACNERTLLAAQLRLKVSATHWQPKVLAEPDWYAPLT